MAPDGWRILSVEQVRAKTEGSIAIGPFGSRMKSSLYTSSGIPVIRGNNLSESRSFIGDFVYVSPETADNLAVSNVFPGDLVFPHRGAIGEVGIVPPEGAGRYILSSSLMKLTCDKNLADPTFLFYFFRSPSGRHELLKNASTVGTPGIGQPLSSLRSIEVPLPPLRQQQEIAHILGALDDKIELSRRMNETLEAMARAIFKSWFVDFDPVRAKAKGRQPFGMDAATAALFPDSFQDSPVGKIPKGWQVDTIKERAFRIQYGLTRGKSDEAVGPRFLRITDIQGGRIDWSKVPYCRVSDEEEHKYKVQYGDIFVARTGASTGENAYVVEAPHAVFASYLVRFQFHDPSIARFVGEYMQTQSYFDYIAGIIGGSAQPNASAQALAGDSLTFPTPAIAERFTNLIQPMDQMRSRNEAQSVTLAAIRDALLPKLISGEIRVKDARVPTEAFHQ